MTTIDIEQLAKARGGMKLDGFRHADNIEDRRTPFETMEDDQWMGTLKNQQSGIDFAKALRDRQIADEWRRASDNLLRPRPAPAMSR
jgi:hypothetical protein